MKWAELRNSSFISAISSIVSPSGRRMRKSRYWKESLAPNPTWWAPTSRQRLSCIDSQRLCCCHSDCPSVAGFGAEDRVGLSLDVMRAELNAVMSNSEPGIAAADALCTTCVGLVGVDGAALSMVHQGASTGTFGSSSEAARRLDEYQFTFGEGPCLDAVASRQAVMVPNLASSGEERWPLLRGALLDDGIQSVFALPVMIMSVCVGALDLFRSAPGPLHGDALAGARLAADLASAPLMDLITGAAAFYVDDEALIRSMQSEPDHLAELDRVEVYQATGMLIAALDVDSAEALARLRAHAIATGQTAIEVARAIVDRRLMLERDTGGGAGRGKG